MSLVDQLRKPPSAFHRERLNVIDGCDFGPVSRRIADEETHIPRDRIQDGINNLKRYYAVALLDPLNPHAVSEAVDPFWHTHVLFTRPYIEFCIAAVGQYIHHEPLDQHDKDKVEHVARLYDHTRDVYEKLFTAVDDSWWPARNGRAHEVVCLHQLLSQPDVVRNALFPADPRLTEGATPEQLQRRGLPASTRN